MHHRHRQRISHFIVLAVCLILAARHVWAEPGAGSDAPTLKTLILPGESFLLDGRPAFVLLPPEAKRRTPQPWIFYAPTLPNLPDEHERWMHEQFLAAGVAVAGIDVGESYGSPAGRTLFTALHRELTTKRGFAAKPCLLARSRGGLQAANWAADHPDRVAGFAGIYPVLDLRSYPGLPKAAPAYGLTPEELGARGAEHNPMDRAAALANVAVPVFLIHGDADKIVPHRANSMEFAARYRAAVHDGGTEAKGDMTLVIVEGQGHNYWDGFFRCRELIDFAIARATAGANPGAK
jgi:dipeptidyl aminopeptidase/acylaminoacyl peptidase